MAKTHSAFHEFQHKGVWWLPSSPERRYHGVLTHQYKNMTIEFCGTDADPSLAADIGADFPFKVPVLHGLLDNGKACTVFDAREIESLPCGSKARVQWLFVGTHFSDIESIRFSEIEIAFTSLDQWMFDENPLVDCQHTAEGWHAISRASTPLNIPVPTINGSVTFGYHARLEPGPTFTCLLHDPYVSLSFKEPEPLTVCRKWMDALRNFLILSVGSPVIADQVRARNSDDQEVEIFYPRPFSHKRESVPNQDMWVSRKLIPDELPNIVSTWFEKYDQLHECIALICGTLYIEDLYSELHFLSLSQALESFSRATANGTDLYLPEQDYAPILAAVTAAIPQNTPNDLRSRLKNALKFGNQISFRKRLQKLLDGLDSQLVNFFCENSSNYISRVIDTRNYLTHYGADSDPAAWKGTQLFIGSQSLRLLLGMLLLREIGLPENVIRDCLIHSNNACQISMWCKASRLDQPA